MDFRLAFSPERIDPGNPTFGLAQHAEGRRRRHPGVRRRRRAPSTASSCDQVVRAAAARARPRWPSCWRTPTGTSTSRWSTRWRCSATSSASTCGTPSGARPPSRSASSRSTPAPASAGTASRSTRTTCPTRCRTLGYPFRFVELAQEINGRMPGYVVERAAELLNTQRQAGQRRPRAAARRHLQDGHRRPARVAGPRRSPASCAAGRRGGLPRPVRAAWQVDGAATSPAPATCEAAVAAADLVILLQAHSALRPGRHRRRARLLLDTRGVTSAGEHLLWTSSRHHRHHKTSARWRCWASTFLIRKPPVRH